MPEFFITREMGFVGVSIGKQIEKIENQVMNSFMDVSIGKQKIKNMKNIVF